MIKRIIGLTIMCILLALMPTACSAPEGDAGTGDSGAESMQSAEAEEPAGTEEAAEADDDTEEETIGMKMTIKGTAVDVSWEDNESVKALAEMAKNAPVTIDMQPYGGFEQVGSIGETLPSNDTDIRTEAGDIMLYTGNQMVIFYGSNSWAYTRLGHINDRDAAGMTELLGNGAVTITISTENP